MSILLARASCVTAILSLFLLMFSWMVNSIMRNYINVKFFFSIAFCFSIMAVITGILSIYQSGQEGNTKTAWLGIIVGLILFVPMGAVVIIFLVMTFSKGAVY